MHAQREAVVSDRSAEKARSALVIPWSWVGYSGLILGIASLGTLVTVVTLQSIDALSTVALVLAVIAFVVQIIVFIAQTVAANEQAQAVQAVNAETRSLLAELRGNTQDTNATLRNQYDKMLDGLLVTFKHSLGTDEVGTPTDDAPSREEIMQDVRLIIEQARMNPPTTSTPEPNVSVRSNLAMLMAANPGPKTRSAMTERIGELSNAAAETLAVFANDYRQFKDNDGDGLVRDPEVAEQIDELESKGLVAVDEDGTVAKENPSLHTYRLTSMGVQAARMILARRSSRELLQEFPWLAAARASAKTGGRQAAILGDATVG